MVAPLLPHRSAQNTNAFLAGEDSAAHLRYPRDRTPEWSNIQELLPLAPPQDRRISLAGQSMLAGRHPPQRGVRYLAVGARTLLHNMVGVLDFLAAAEFINDVTDEPLYQFTNQVTGR